MKSVEIRRHSTAALVLGRALHAPWNEGTRVIGRNFAVAAASLRPVRVVSLTQEAFRCEKDQVAPVDHVYVRAGYGAIGDYVGLPGVIRRVGTIMETTPIGVAHVIGLPLALAPWLCYRKVWVVAHVTLAAQAYMGAAERLRNMLGWRAFEKWVDAYALSSQALVDPLLARGIPKEKLTIVPASIDTLLFSPGAQDEARAKLGLRADEFIVVYVGTLSPLRFPTATVREGLLKVCGRTKTPVRLFAFAPAATHGYNRAWHASVQHELREIPNAEVKVDLRDMTDVDKTDWFRAADVVLLPFAGPVAVEPPLTLLEAMASGAVVLATSYANRSQLIQSGINGTVYATPVQMARQLIDVYDGRAESWNQNLREAARETVVQRHSQAAAADAAARVWDLIEQGRKQADRPK